MNCPKCNIELPTSHCSSRCEACGAVLDCSLAAESSDESLVDLLKTTDIALLAVIQSVLQSAEIPFAMQGEEGLHVLPLATGGFFNPSTYGAVIRVHSEDLADARRMLEQAVSEIEDGDKNVE